MDELLQPIYKSDLDDGSACTSILVSEQFGLKLFPDSNSGAHAMQYTDTMVEEDMISCRQIKYLKPLPNII